jgi:hypothetical protein
VEDLHFRRAFTAFSTVLGLTPDGGGGGSVVMIDRESQERESYSCRVLLVISICFRV